MDSEKKRLGPLSFSDSIGLIAFTFSMVAFVVTPAIWLKIFLLLIASCGILILVRLSHWSHRWSFATQSIVSAAFLGLFLFTVLSQVNNQLVAEHRESIATLFKKVGTTLLRYIGIPWPSRILFLSTGVALAIGFRACRDRYQPLLRKTTTVPAEKGFLDHRLQAETAITQLSISIAPITGIMTEVGEYLAKQALLIHAVQLQPTTKQLQIVTRTARGIDTFSKRMESKCTSLEQVSNELSEGMLGWFVWVAGQTSAVEIFLTLEPSLSRLTESTEGAEVQSEAYLSVIEGARGVSKEMNMALDNHIKVVSRVKNANHVVLVCCRNALEIARRQYLN